MRALDYRLATFVALPWALGGCPSDDVTPSTGSDDSTTAAADSTTGTPPDPSTSTTLPPATTDPDTTDDTTTAAATDSTGSATMGTSSTGAEEESEGTAIPSVCGDNVVEGTELCDLAQLGGETCQSQGFEGGQLGCLLTCDAFNTLGCFICGNEIIDLPEDCEGGVPAGVTCESIGFQGGELRCGDDCLYDTTDCSICGDGIRQGEEQCDALDYDGQTCAGLGFDGGVLGCNLAECEFNYTACDGGVYTQDFESGALPPEFSVGITSPWFVDDAMPIDGVFSARSGPFAAGVGGITDLTLSASFPVDGEISFRHIESTGAGVDFLEFYIDGLQGGTWSGQTLAATHTQPVTAGDHTFQWRFNRAGFLDEGANAVWVDNITLTGGIATP